MATAATVIMQPTCNLTSLTAANFSSSSSARCGALRTHNKSILSSAPRRRHQCLQVRAAVDKSGKDSIDRFAEGVKSDASKNSKNFGQMVSDAVGDAEETVRDVGRDMGAKTQEALDAVERKFEQAGDKAQDVGQEVKGSTRDTFDSAADTTDGQSITDKAKNAADNVGNNLKQNFDYGTGAVQGAADDAKQEVEKADRSVSL